MNIIENLASSLGRRDETPNMELAKIIASASDKSAVEELVENLANKNEDIQNDCIKVFYEIGNLKPSLISPYINQFIDLLENKNNRLQWGAMTALNYIANENQETIFSNLSKLASAADKGSVITRDNYVSILTKLCSVKKYSNDVLILLHEQFLKSPANQLPMYAENALHVIDKEHRETFIKTLSSRLDDMEKESKRKRVEKIIKKLQAK